MSAYDGYDDEPRRYRNVRTRPRERDEPDLVREEVYIERGKGTGPRGAELVYRGRDDSIEDIPRDFPPPGRSSRRSEYADSSAPRRSKSTGGRRYDDDDYSDDDRYTDYGGRAAAGAAGYAAGRGRSDRDRRPKRDDRDYDSEYSNSPPRRERKKSGGGVGDLLGSLGLGGLVGGLAGGNKDKDKDRSRSRSRSRGGRSQSRGARGRRGYSSDDSRRSRSRGGNNERKWAQAAQAALVAGAVEAFRSRKTPGPWTGEKGKRIATAALGAGGIDGLVSGKNPEEKSKRHLAGAVIGGLGINRAANGSRSQVRGGDSRSVSPDGRPRSRSRSVMDRLRGRSQSRGRNSEAGGGGNGALGKGLLGAGAAAVAGKAIFDKVRSKSRKRRSPSNSSADSYVPSRTRQRDRRRSPRSDTASTRRTDGPGLRGGQDDRALARGGNRGGNYAAAAGAGAGAGALATRGGGGGGDKADAKGKDDGNDSDNSSSTTDMEKTRKHMRGKEIITATLASVATIHAAHGVYSSMEAHEKRHKLVAEGTMSPEEARKKQTKAWIQDAAAVGIAALGIKGAFSEWKEMNEQRREIQNLERRKGLRRKKRIAQEKADERERHERLMSIMEKNPNLAMGYHAAQVGGVPQVAGPPPQPDLSGNPYAPRDGGNQRY